MDKILLIDGNSMMFRAYFATMRQRMTSKDGQPTNAIFGFSNMLTKAIEMIEPDYCLVAFDTAAKTFRHEQFQDYKAHRKPLDHNLISQFPVVREFLDHYPMVYKEIEGYEADDIIGTLSRRYEGKHKIILTSDRDMLQLINDDVHVLLMKKGITEMQEVNLKILKDEYHLEPKQVIDLKALMGDPSDNIPGVAGVGEKTAMRLLGEYHNIDNLYDNIDDLKGKLKENLVNQKDIAYLSKELATIYTDVPIEIDLTEATTEMDAALLSQFYRRYDMNSLLRRIEILPEGDEKSVPVVAFDQSFLQDNVIISPLVKSGNGYGVEVEGYLVGDKKHIGFIDYETSLSDPIFKQLIEGNYTKRMIDGKNVYHSLLASGFELDGFVDDLLILSYLVDSSISTIDKLKDKHDLWRHDLDKRSQEIALMKDAFELFEQYHGLLDQYEMTDLYEDVEFPLLEVLVEMERTGIKVDENTLADLAAQTQKQVDDLAAKIHQLANKEFNVNSPKQLSEVLFDDLGLKGPKKRSTAVDVLEKLIDDHEIIPYILEYRKYQKFLSTYADGLQKYVTDEGRIHTTYSQTVAQTGRLSSVDPNLQNISVRNEETRIIRSVFVADEGYKLLSCDYSQIELRVLAHMANEKELIEAFNENQDIHTKTAREIFELEDNQEVTPLMRRQAKAVNFGIVYGISDFGLSQQLDITPSEANKFITNYLNTFSGIQEYMDTIVAYCEEHGYVKTLYGRRRQMPEILDKNFVIRDRARRAAMNSPIQGTAADLIKMAMISVSDNLKKMKAKSKMILQVHDELVILVAKDEVDTVTKLVVDSMKNVAKLKVPLDVSYNVGDTWYEV